MSRHDDRELQTNDESLQAAHIKALDLEPSEGHIHDTCSSRMHDKVHAIPTSTHSKDTRQSQP